MFRKQYPQGLQIVQHVEKDKSLGSLENYFNALSDPAQRSLADKEMIDFLKYMLRIAPSQRPAAEEVLRHPFFDDCPDDVVLPLEQLLE